MKTKSLFGLALVAGITLFAGTAFAQGKMWNNTSGRPMWGNCGSPMQGMCGYGTSMRGICGGMPMQGSVPMPMLMGLNLTSDQINQIAQLRMQHFTKTAGLRTDMQKKQSELQQLMSQDSPDMELIQQKTIELNKLRTDLQLSAMQLNTSINKILTKQEELKKKQQ